MGAFLHKELVMKRPDFWFCSRIFAIVIVAIVAVELFDYILNMVGLKDGMTWHPHILFIISGLFSVALSYLSYGWVFKDLEE